MNLIQHAATKLNEAADALDQIPPTARRNGDLNSFSTNRLRDEAEHLQKLHDACTTATRDTHVVNITGGRSGPDPSGFGGPVDPSGGGR